MTFPVHQPHASAQITTIRKPYRHGGIREWDLIRQVFAIAVELGRHTASQELVVKALMRLAVRFHKGSLAYQDAFKQSGTLEWCVLCWQTTSSHESGYHLQRPGQGLFSSAK